MNIKIKALSLFYPYSSCGRILVCSLKRQFGGLFGIE